MDLEKIGKRILAARKKAGMTQEALAEQVGVSVQAVSKWETGRNLPDIENLIRIAELTNTPYTILLSLERDGVSAGDFGFRSRLFHEENMFTRLKALTLSEGLHESYRALHYMRETHLGQFRKQGRHARELVEYINHPLLMACQAHAFGIRDDSLLAAILLHDVAEDTGTAVEELPFSDEVRQLVALVTFSVPAGLSKEEAKERYYAAIRENGKACVIKIIDRCSNVSTMADSFSREKLIAYIWETETFILPLMTVLKNQYPEYSDLAFLTKYHVISVIETIKSLLIE